MNLDPMSHTFLFSLWHDGVNSLLQEFGFIRVFPWFFRSLDEVYKTKEATLTILLPERVQKQCLMVRSMRLRLKTQGLNAVLNYGEPKTKGDVEEALTNLRKVLSEKLTIVPNSVNRDS